MATAEYAQRESFYQRARECAQEVLAHPDLETPDHPYVPMFSDMLDYAALGVLDKRNGLVHAVDQLVCDSVVLIPTLKSDFRRTGQLEVDFTCAGALFNDSREDDLRNVTVYRDTSASCDLDSAFLCPLIGLAYWLEPRSLQLGMTLVHELDHAYWWWQKDTMFKHGGMDTPTARAEMEISAYRLEQQLFFAHEPDLYDREYGDISVKFANLDFSRPYIPRDTNKIRLAARVTAFTNFIFDSLGADVGKRPTPKVMEALVAQRFI